MDEEKVIIMHGFDQDEVVAIMRAAKSAVPAAKEAAFATSTPTNLGWKLSEILEHVAEEHRHFRETKKA